MKQYLDLLRRIRDTGTRQANRTGIDSIFVPGAMMQFDLREGFPAVTTKKLFFKKLAGELIGFLRGYSTAEEFRSLGCDIWDKNANDPGKEGSPNAWLTNKNRKGEDDLGRIYGVQWRHWRGKPILEQATPVFADAKSMHFMAEMNYIEVDQVANVLNKLKTNPTDRRMIINAWRPDEFDQMALPPCHILSQLLADVSNNKLHLCYYQRSCDFALGVPFNVASYALMLFIFAELTGFTPGTLSCFMADTHIYTNHLDGISEQLARAPYPSPKLVYSGPSLSDLYAEHGSDVFNYIDPAHFTLGDYHCHPAIDYPMAV